MHRYWFEFCEEPAGELPPGCDRGCGVTALDRTDALQILQTYVFGDQVVAPIARVIEDIDIRELDQGHVVPNMEPPNGRGVWFPRGYDRPRTSDTQRLLHHRRAAASQAST